MYTFFEQAEPKIYTSHTTHSHNFKSHFHGKLELTYCFSGKQKIRIGDTDYILEKGDAAIIFPNVVHEYIAVKLENDDTECISVMSNTDFFTGTISSLVTSRPLSPIVKNAGTLENVEMAFRKIVNAGDETECVGWTMVALSSLVKNITVVSVRETDDFRLAPSLVSYIDENFQKPLTIKFLAKEFGYSESYIAHVFYDQLKIPFRTYLGNVRSEYAANLIKTTNKSMTEIAYECGYGNLNTFCRCFKKRYGKTPNEYKKELM